MIKYGVEQTSSTNLMHEPFQATTSLWTKRLALKHKIDNHTSEMEVMEETFSPERRPQYIRSGSEAFRVVEANSQIDSSIPNMKKK